MLDYRRTIRRSERRGEQVRKWQKSELASNLSLLQLVLLFDLEMYLCTFVSCNCLRPVRRTSVVIIGKIELC